ncbi:MAG: hypothetical protein ACRD18_01835 [Terriglobia bacterium]
MKKLITLLFTAALALSLGMPVFAAAMPQDAGQTTTQKTKKHHHHHHHKTKKSKKSAPPQQ